jgi:hypothetical protein
MFCLARPPYPSFYLDSYPRLCPTPYPSRYPKPYPSRLSESYPSVLPDTLSESLLESYLSMLLRILPKRLPKLYPDTYPIKLTWPYPISYSAELAYSIFSRSDFCVPDHTRSPYPTSLPDRVTLYCPDYLPSLTQSPFPVRYSSTGLTRKLPHQPSTLT